MIVQLDIHTNYMEVLNLPYDTRIYATYQNDEWEVNCKDNVKSFNNTEQAIIYLIACYVTFLSKEQ